MMADLEQHIAELEQRARDVEGDSDNPLRVAAANRLYDEAAELRKQLPNTRPLTGGVTPEMVEAGWEAFNQHDDYRTAMREAYLAMSNVSRGVE